MIKPIILEETTSTLLDLESIKNSNKIWKVIDNYKEQLEELFTILNPGIKLSADYNKFLDKFTSDRTTSNGKFLGTWVYFPWNGNLLHILNKNEFNKVRTNRNQKIINAEEQDLLYNFNVAILGLSIGNGMALSLVYSGISNNLKIADFDILELSNLNRVRMSLSDLGSPKIDVTSQQIYEINPYAELEAFTDGVNKDNIAEFINGKTRPKLIFEAIDDFEIKIKIRLEAKKFAVPVIMLTNLGDRLLIDVERYDTDKDLVLFNGLIGDVAEEILSKPIKEADKQHYAVALVGKQNLSQRVLETLPEINKTLVGRPQVMSTVTIGGGVASYLTRRLALGELNSGRYLIDFESLIS